MRIFLICSALTLLAGASESDGVRYNACLALTKSAPEKALSLAAGWRIEGGGAAAMHCQALALIEQGHAARAAGVLDAAAQSFGPQPKATGFAGEIWAQAGNAWLLAGDSDRAIARLTTALGLLPQTGRARDNALIDRARAFADKAQWEAAIADLDAAATRAPSNADVFLLRATAKRRKGDLGGAHTDIQMAGTLAPDNLDILVERGISFAQSQQIDPALADWRKVVALAPESDQAKIARGYLGQLEHLASTPVPAARPAKPKKGAGAKPAAPGNIPSQ